MSPLGTDLLAHVQAAVRRLRRDGAAGAVALALAVLPLLLVVGWLVADVRLWSSPGPVPLLLWGAAAAGAAALVFVARRRDAERFTEARVAREAERRFTLPEGAVHGILELQRTLPRGTSAALYRHAAGAVAARLEGGGELTGELGRRALRRRRIGFGALGTLALMVVGLALASPQRARAGWSPLLHPVSHMVPLPLPELVVAPGNAEVPRGEPLEVRVAAAGRSAVTLHWRAEGDVPGSVVLAVRGDAAVGTLPPVDAATVYRVAAPDGARSAEFEAVPIDPLLVADLEIRVVYPAYLEREADHWGADVPALEIPAGTRLELSGRATRPLAAVELVSAADGPTVRVPVDGASFAGGWTPRQDGVWLWSLRDSAATPAVPPAPLEIRVVEDAPPEVRITFPGGDTIIDPSLTQALAAEARDDHAVAAATLLSWRVRAGGGAEAVVEEPMPVPFGGERLALRTVLNARGRDLLPGDTLKVQVRVTDDSPGGQIGASAVLSLHVPSAAEQRERARGDAAAALEEAAQLARAAGEVGEATRGVERRTTAGNARRGTAGGGGSAGNSGQGGMDFAQAEEARQILDQQEALMGRAAELAERVDAVQRAMQAAGLQDPALRERLDELRRLYDEALTPEMRRQLEALSRGLENLDPEAVEEALRELAAEQEQFRRQMERSVEMLEKAAAEQEMNALAQETRELAAQQQALAEAMGQQGADSTRAARQQELRERGSRLEEALRKLQETLGEQSQEGAGEQVGQAADEVGAAVQAQERAAADAAAGEGQSAAEEGARAAEQLEETAERLDGARRRMAEQWQEEAEESVRQATNDALSLAEKQNEVLERMRQGDQGEQGQQGGQQVQPPTPPQTGQQQGQGQQGGQQQGGQQQGGQQQGGQQQGGQQQGGQQGGQQQGGQQQGQSGGAAGQGGGVSAEQAALQQGLEQLSRNLTEAGERTALMDPSVGAALGRANLAMEQTMEALRQNAGQEAAAREAERTLDALNRLALSLLESSERMGAAESGAGQQQALDQLTEMAQAQGNLNGQAQSLSSMNLPPEAMARQMRRLSQAQREIGGRLSGVNDMLGGAEDVLGQLDALAREAQALAREMSGERLPPELLARQERLFHRLLDAGRSLERDETSQERQGERAGAYDPRAAGALDPAILDTGMRYRVPTPAQLEAVPPALRRLIVEYFERLNRLPPGGGS